MAKSIDKILEEAYQKKENLEKSRSEISEKLKSVNQEIKDLEREKKKQQGDLILKKIEAEGFNIEDVLKMMEHEKSKKEGEPNI